MEIGTRQGESLRYIALQFSVASYIAVDPFITYEDYRGDGFDTVLQTQGGDDIHDATRALGKSLLGERFELIRDFASEASEQIRPLSVNFGFVDGNHTYSYVLADLENYWPKISPGGYLCGHDYFMRSADAGGNYSQPMVFEAVCDFAAEQKLHVETFGKHRGFPMCFAIQK